MCFLLFTKNIFIFESNKEEQFSFLSKEQALLMSPIFIAYKVLYPTPL